MVLLFSVASVSAQQNTTDTVRVTDDNDDAVIHSDSDTNLSTTKSDDILTTSDNNDDVNDNLGFSDSNDVLTADNPNGTFSDLYDDVKDGGEITLDRDYVYNDSKDSLYKDGVLINKTIIINGNGHILNGNNQSKILNIAADKVILNNITFINSYFENHMLIDSIGLGSAVLWSGNYGTMMNCNLIDCYAWKNNGECGILAISGSNNKIINCNFNRDIVDYSSGGSPDGAAIVIRGINNIIDYCNFTNCYALGSGGAIYITGEYNTVSNSYFENNSCTAEGGGAILIYAPNIKVINSTFINNTCYSTWGGGAIDMDKSATQNVLIDNCKFINNHAKYQGGAIDTNSNIKECTIIGCLFEGNTANTTGGAISSTGSSSISIYNSEFSKNTANSIENSIYTSSSSSIYIDDSNTGLTDENVQLNDATILVNDDFYIAPTAKGKKDGSSPGDAANWTYAYEHIASGRTIYFTEGSYYDIFNQDIFKTLNLKGLGTVTIDLQQKGRAFIISSQYTSIDSINIINGKMDYGGAIYWSGTYGTLSNCKLENNQADIVGGAIYLSENIIANISESSFISNTAISGGAIYLSENIIANISESKFINNNAEDNGAAIYSENGKNITIINPDYQNNKAKKGGNDYYILDATKNILYVGPNGTGFGSSRNDLTSFSYAYTHIINGGTIYLTSGTYTEIFNINLKKSLNIVGLGDVTINSQQKGRVFTISSDYTTISNIKFINGNPNKPILNYGGAIYWNNNYGKVINCSFENNFASTGGAIFWNRVYGSEINNCSFMSNSASNSGGAVYYDGGSNCEIINSNFTNNSAKSYGGGIYENRPYNTNIINCSFNSNIAETQLGGAIYCQYIIILKIDNSNFTNNVAKQVSGGAVYVYYSANNVTIANSRFINNTANNGGGAIRLLNATGTISNSTFIGNTAKTNAGGAIYWDTGANTNGTIINSNFTNNKAYSHGGAIYWASGMKYNIINSNFNNNTAIYGGAISWVYSLNANIINSSFVGNLATGNTSYGGGAILNRGPNFICNNSNFINNTAYYYGGAISCWSGSNSTIMNSNFTDNTAYYWAGAIHFASNNGKIISSNFINNQAVYDSKIRADDNLAGGAIFWRGVNGTLLNSNFTQNKVSGTGEQAFFEQGGAIYWEQINGYIDNCNFINNTARSGGAICIGQYAPNNTILNSKFINNFAKYLGGAIIVRAANSAISFSNFTKNTAVSNGGAISSEGLAADDNITYCSFNNNSAYKNGGAIYWTKDRCSIYYSNFTDNVAIDNGGAIYWTGAKGTVTYSNFTNNSAFNLHDIYADCTDFTMTYNNFVGDYIKVPEFISRYYDNDFYIEISHLNYKVEAQITLNTYILVDREVNASTVDHTKITLLDWSRYPDATYIGSVNYIDLDGNNTNTYTNNPIKFILSSTDTVLYISPNGQGNGSKNNATNWNDALKRIGNGGTIVLLDGTYYDIINQAIRKTITISGSDKTVLDALKQGRMFYIYNDDVTIENITFINGYINANGGAIYWNGTNGNVVNSRFINNSVDNYDKFNIFNGGAIYWAGANGHLINSSFISNIAYSFIGITNFNYGGAIYWSGDKAEILNCNFSDNHAYYSGALHLNSVNATMDNCIFSDNSLNRNNGNPRGGAMSWYGANGTLTNSKFYRNSAKMGDGDGGAIYWNGANAYISNCEFENNSCIDAGADIVFENANSNAQVYSSTFKNGQAVGSDDSGSVWSDMRLTMKDCLFSNVTTTVRGGAIEVYIFADILNCTFIDCTADYGGAIYVTSGCTAIVTNCNFTGNAARKMGGAIYWGGANGKISNSNFTNNTASELNDIYSTQTDLISENNKFIGDYLRIPEFISLNYLDVFVELSPVKYDVTFTIFVNGYNAQTGTITVNNEGHKLIKLDSLTQSGNYTISVTYSTANNINTYSNNREYNVVVDLSPIVYVSVDGNGSGRTNTNPTNWNDALGKIGDGVTIKLLNGTYTTIVNQEIRNIVTIVGSGNTTIDAKGQGRIFYIVSNNVTIEKITFTNACFVDGSGGAIYWNGANGRIFNSAFINNTAIINNANARAHGGAIYWNGANGTIDSCLFKNNSINGSGTYNYGGAVYIASNGKYCNITNSIFEDNTAENTGALVVYASNFYMANCNFTNNNAYKYHSQCYFGRDNVVIDNCNFIGSKGATDALQLEKNRFNMTISNCNFINMSSKNSVLVISASKVNISYCNFTKCSAGDTGVVDVYGDNIEVKNCNFRYNQANMGGAIAWYGSNGNLNSCEFYNNTANQGSAIYTTKALTISNSIFLDNLARDSILYYTFSDDVLTVTFLSGDNYLNAIYANNTVPTFSSVTYWGVNGRSTTSETGDSNYKIDVDLYDKYSHDLKRQISNQTVNDNVVLDDIASGSYIVSASHYTGPTRVTNISFEINVGKESKLDLLTTEEILDSSYLVIVANVNNAATGNVTFSINNNNYTVIIKDSVAKLTLNETLGVGVYTISAFYSGDSVFYQQVNSTKVIVSSGSGSGKEIIINTRMNITINNSIKLEGLCNSLSADKFKFICLTTFLFLSFSVNFQFHFF